MTQLKKHLDSCDKKIFLVSENYGDTIESLLSVDVKKSIDCGSKTLNSKRFIRMVEKGELEIDQETSNNFSELFKKIGILK